MIEVKTTGGRVRVLLHPGRVETAEALDAAEKHLPAATLVIGPGVELVAQQAVAGVVAAEGFRTRIEPGQAFISAQPQETLLVFKDAIDHVVRQSVTGRIMLESTPLAVELIQPPAKGPDPQHAGAIFVDRHDVIPAQALRIVRIEPVVRNAFTLAIEAVQATAIAAHPEHALAIFVNSRARFQCPMKTGFHPPPGNA